MSTVADCLTARADDDIVGFDAVGRSVAPPWSAMVSSTWKAAHLLRHHGVHDASTVAIVVGPGEPDAGAAVGRLGETPEPLFGLLGALAIGATIDLEPASSVSATALLAPAAWHDQYEMAPGGTRLAYGAVPESAAMIHFERARWSENAVAPPETVSPDTASVRGLSQATLLDQARDIAAAGDFGHGVVVRTSGRLTAAALPGAVLAPLVSGATILGGEGAADHLVDESGAVSSSGTPGTHRA